MSHCLDTSAYFDAYKRYYRPKIFPSVWTFLDELAQQGKIRSPEEVYKEIQKKSDWIHDWAKQRKDKLFVPVDEEQQEGLREIMEDFEALVNHLNKKSAADPWVISLARTQELTVVTAEQGGKASKPKIPYVCERLKVKCCTLTDMFEEFGLKL